MPARLSLHCELTYDVHVWPLNRTEFYSNSGSLIQSTSFGEGVLNFLTCLSTTFSKQAVKALANLCVCAWADSEGTGGADTPPLKNHNTIGFPSNTGPDLQKNHKVTKPVFNVGPSYVRQAFRWQANVGPLMVVFGTSLPS